MTNRTLGILELVLAGAAATGSVLRWVAARSTEVVAPILPGEPSRSTITYDPSTIGVAVFLAMVAGLLLVAGVGRLRQG